MIVSEGVTILYDIDFNINGFFEYLDDLPEEEYNVVGIYSLIVHELLDNIEYSSEFKFKIPSSDEEMWVHLKEKKSILKVLDIIIDHLHKYELYEVIEDFLKIREYYDKFEFSD